MGDPHGGYAALLEDAKPIPEGNEQEQHRQTGNDFRHHQRRGNQRAEQGFAAETAEARHHHGGHGTQYHSRTGGEERQLQADLCGIDHLLIAEQLEIPLGGESGPDGDQLGLVERIDNQAEHRQIQKQEADGQHDHAES